MTPHQINLLCLIIPLTLLAAIQAWIIPGPLSISILLLAVVSSVALVLSFAGTGTALADNFTAPTDQPIDTGNQDKSVTQDGGEISGSRFSPAEMYFLMLTMQILTALIN